MIKTKSINKRLYIYGGVTKMIGFGIRADGFGINAEFLCFYFGLEW